MPGIPGPLIVSARHILDRIDRIDQALKPRNARVGIAAIMLSAAQKAFATEEFGGEPWPVRYPQQAGPFINKAAALHRLNRNLGLPPRIFGRKGTLVGTSQMLNEVNSSAFSRLHRGDTLEIGWGGPAREYAGIHQTGGKSTQRITQAGKKQLAQVRKDASGSERKAIDAQMGFMYSQDSLTTEVHARPSIGFTPEIEQDINTFLVEFLEGKVPGL